MLVEQEKRRKIMMNKENKEILLEQFNKNLWAFPKEMGDVMELLDKEDKLYNSRYTIVNSIADGIRLISNISYSINSSLGYSFYHSFNDTEMVEKVFEKIGEDVVVEMVDKMFDIQDIPFNHIYNKDYNELKEEIVSHMLKSDYKHHYRVRNHRTTSGGVSYGWKYLCRGNENEKLYIFYIGYTRRGSLIEEAAKAGFMSFPTCSKRYIMDPYDKDMYGMPRMIKELAKKETQVQEYLNEREYKEE